MHWPVDYLQIHVVASDYAYVGMSPNLYTEATGVVLACHSLKDLTKLLVCDNISASCPEIVLYDSCRPWIASDPVKVGLSGPDVCDPFNESVAKIWRKEPCNPLKEQVCQVIST